MHCRNMYKIYIFFLTLFNGIANDCIEPPNWMTLNVSSNCEYNVKDEKYFIDVEFTHFLEELSFNTSNKVKLIYIPKGTYIFNKSIKVSGFNGWKIQLIGYSKESTKFVFNNINGIDIEGPSALGLVDNLTINGNKQLGKINHPLYDKYGVLARRGAVIKLGKNVIIEEFSRAGVQAYMSSTIFAEGVISRNNGSDGFVASYNSTVYAKKSISMNNRGDGYFCEAASSIDAREANAIRNYIDLSNGQKRGGDGFVAILGSVINAIGSSAIENEDQDFINLSGGLINKF